MFKSFDAFYEDCGLLAPHVVAPKDCRSQVAFLGYSSGTSGKAKGVRTSHFNMCSLLSMLAPLDVSPKDKQLVVLPLNHIYGTAQIRISLLSIS